MKTKGTSLRVLLTVFTALAMVASLCAVAAAPAGANSEPLQWGATPLDPDSGPVGKLVTVTVNGTDVSLAGQVVTLEYDGETVETTPAEPTFPDKDSFNATAGETLSFYFEVPESTEGDHDVQAFVGAVSTNTTQYTVEPKVTIDPDEGAKGSTATATCTGFAAGKSIDVKADDTVVGSTTESTSKGSATISCTMDTSGNITATDGAGNSAVHTPDTFSFEPGISLDPTSGAVCDTVTVSASEFTSDNTSSLTEFTIAGENITNKDSDNVSGNLTELSDYSEDDLEPGEWITTSAYDKTDDEFEVKFQVPSDLSAGAKTVYLKTNEDQDASATFTVGEATMEIDPTEGPKGQTVTVDASGLAPDKDNYYDLLMENESTDGYKVLEEDLDTDTEGKLSTSFEVPSENINGDTDYDVYLTKADTTAPSIAKDTYHVIPASLTVTPDKGPVGTEVTITGKGYGASTGYDILFDDPDTGMTTNIGYVTTTDVGGFTMTATIPSSSKGDATIRDDSGKADDTFEVTVPKAQVEVEEGMKVGGVLDKLSESVWYFNNSDKSWSQYYKANPSAVPSESRLTTLKSGKAYWVYVTQDCTLKYGGKEKDLTKGWNSIVWP